ncbi:MAG: hypothetical protein DRO99_04060 [Candidatus Aenigmatarchaeota archaeon]|nr:MAG: hypothetical protein DRO99_04060 [Candidatus Aenigmarchaeota archaeon]
MADSKERMYVISLKRDWQKTRRDGRANRSVNVIREYLEKHLKTDNIKISSKLNESLWKRGNSKPPAKVKVKVTESDDVFTVRLPDEVVIEKKEEKKSKVAGLKERAMAARTGGLGAALPAKEEPKQDKTKEKPKSEETKK